MGFRHAPQLTLFVILFRGQDLPAVFINVEHPAIVDMANTNAPLGFHYPDPVQLVAGQLLVDVVRANHIRGANVVVMQLVRIVRNQQFPLAFQLPVVLVRGTVVHVFLVNGTQRRRVGQICLVGQVR